MKKLLLSALAGLCLLANVASAATYYVWGAHSNARDTNSGTSITAPKKTLTSLKTGARPGDVIRLYAGNYTWTPFDSAGSNPTGGGYITVIGTHTLADPLTDPVAREVISINASVEPPQQGYLSIKGIKISSSVHFGNGNNRDSLLNCTVLGDLEIGGGDYNVIANNIIKGTRVSIGRSGSDRVSDGNKIISNQIPNLGLGITGGGPGFTEHFWMQGSGSGPNFVDSTYVWFNRVTFNPGSLAGDGNMSGPTLLHTSDQFSRGNRWYYNLEKSNDYIFRLRDSTNGCRFDVDTVLVSGGGSGIMELSSSGSALCDPPGDCAPNVFNNAWDSCFVNVSGAAVRPMFLDGMIDCSITNSTWASRDYALFADLFRGANVLNHNTFMGSAAYGVVNFEMRDDAPALVDTNITFTNNIVAALNPAVVDPTVDGGASHVHSGLRLGGLKWDSTTAMRQQEGVVINHNTYSYFGSAARTGDRSIHIRDKTNFYASTPGDSTASNVGGLAENRWRLDSLSVYGSSKLGGGGADSAATITFDPTLGYRSRARSDHSGASFDAGLDMGAIQFGGVTRLATEYMPLEIHFSVGSADTFYFPVYAQGNDDGDNSGDTPLIYTFTISLSSVTCPGAAGIQTTVDLDALTSSLFGTAHPLVYDGTGTPTTGSVTIVTNDPATPILVIPITVY